MFSDQPVKNSNQDQFGRANFSKRIAQVIASRKEKDSIVIGIHAPWGEGKTSVLNMIVEELESNENLLILNFNPWRFPDENSLLKNFFRFLAEKFDASLNTVGEKLSNFANKYAGVLSPISAFGFDAKTVVKGLAETIPEADLEGLRERIEKILDNSEKRIVIIMDDIDRLDKDEIQSIFRLVKLSADFPNTAYILSFDIDRVSDALAEKYGSKEAGQNFLEKIVQVSLPLPPATPESLRKMAYEELDKLLEKHKIELSKNDAGSFGWDFQKIFDSKLKNPRLVKRYINRLTFLLPILQNEVNVLDLMFIEAAHVFYPNLYEKIRDNPTLFLGDTSGWETNVDKQQREKFLKDEMNLFPEREKDRVNQLVTKLFPKTQGVIGNTHYRDDWNIIWAREKRIASPDYFLRYFNYGIPTNDISDIELQNFLRKLSSQPFENNICEIGRLISRNKENVFLRKLRQTVDLLEENVAIALAKTVSLTGGLFTRKSVDESVFGKEPFSQACILIRNCLERVKEIESRDEIVLELVKTATPLDFAGEYVRWNHNFRTSDSNIKKVFISDECEKELFRQITLRIISESKGEVIEQRYPQKSGQLYYYWLNNDSNSLINFLRERFEANPENVKDFICSFGRQSREMSGIVNSFGFDFVISAIEKFNPELARTQDIEPLMLKEAINDEDYLSEFLRIYRTNRKNRTEELLPVVE